MAATIYVKPGAIAGEATEANHVGWIEAVTFEWGATQTAQIGAQSSGAGAGKASLQPAVLTAQVSSASPQLFVACTQGTVLPEVDVDFVKTAGTGLRTFLQLKLRTVVVSAYAFSAGDGGPGTETVTFAYGQVQVTYVPQNPATGQAGTPVVAGWDRVRNVTV